MEYPKMLYALEGAEEIWGRWLQTAVALDEEHELTLADAGFVDHPDKLVAPEKAPPRARKAE